MITVKKTKDGFEVSGHAEYADHGQDIVCAGASAMALFAIELLEMHTDIEKTVVNGNVKVALRDTSEGTDEIIETYQRMMRRLAHQYPNYVQIVEQGDSNGKTQRI